MKPKPITKPIIGVTYEDVVGTQLTYKGKSQWGFYLFISSNNNFYCTLDFNEPKFKGKFIPFYDVPLIFLPNEKQND